MTAAVKTYKRKNNYTELDLMEAEVRIHKQYQEKNPEAMKELNKLQTLIEKSKIQRKWQRHVFWYLIVTLILMVESQFLYYKYGGIWPVYLYQFAILVMQLVAVIATSQNKYKLKREEAEEVLDKPLPKSQKDLRRRK